jgi:L-alanine-DL-glutamate epimerase-like enolase superfamily enzyme
VKTFCTIGISGKEELEEKIAELRGFPLIKIKSDQRADIAAVRTVRERTGAMLAVDANGSWADVDIASVSRELAALGVVFIEQPLPPAEDRRMEDYSAASALPVLADESCVTAGDVERLAGRFAGFNIKLVKCGGLTPALAMARRARELGLRTMVGCMLESSLLIAAGAVVAQQADYADLDGAWLLADDPFEGAIPLRHGILEPNARPGFGV